MWTLNKYFRRLNFSIKILAPMFLVLQASIGGVSWILIESMSSNLRNEYLSKGTALVKGLAYNAQDSLLNRDTSWLQTFIDDYKTIQGVGHVYVVCKNNNVSAHSFVPEFPHELLELYKLGEMKTGIESKEISINGKKRLNIIVPILAGTLGYAAIGMDLDLLEEQIWVNIKRIILYAILISLASCLITLLVLLNPIRNIRHLTKISHQVSDGYEALPNLKLFSDDDLGTLATNFSKMLVQLQFQKKHLEEMVLERTSRLNEANNSIQTMIDSLGQGFLVFDKSGKVLPGVSIATIKFLNLDPVGMPIDSIFPIADKERKRIKNWQELISDISPDEFTETLPFVPSHFKSGGMYYELSFKPIIDSFTQNSIEKIVCVISDKTEEHELSKKNQKERALVKILISVLQDRESFADFVHETRSQLEEFRMEIAKDFPSLSFLFRTVHTIKGNCSVFYLTEVCDLAHSLENLLADKNQENFFAEEKRQIKLDFDKMQASFENFLSHYEVTLGQFWKKVGRHYSISEFAIRKTLKVIKEETGEESQSYKLFRDNILLEDLEKFFMKYESQVTELATKQNKIVRFRIKSNNIRILARPYLTLISSFTHAFRNIIDHGIETPDIRSLSSKSDFGNIVVNFQKVLNHKRTNENSSEALLRIEIRDDGVGVDPEMVKAKAIQKKIVTPTEASRLTQNEILQLLFSKGFSTKEKITEISGRGFGLDIIKFEAQQLGGKAWLESTMGSGTTLVVEVPFMEKFT